jgi:energy-coupling factor transporter ATP-binding protein EcfA2
VSYASNEQFVANAHAVSRLPQETPVVLLTGPPGVGKSQVIRAIRRLMSKNKPVQASKDLPEFPVQPVASVEIRTSIAQGAFLSEILWALGIEVEYKNGNGNDLRHARLRAYQYGCCGVHLDEFQFASMSSGANTQAAKLLTLAAELGMPVLYAANYDLGHKLKKRPAQDRARFLFKPIIMLPDLPEDPAFIGLLEDIKVALDGALQIDAIVDGPEIHSMSFGLRRLVIRLVVCGYEIARIQHRKGTLPLQVTMDHIRAAYDHTDYGSDREDVENFQAALLGLRDVKSDYICPVVLPAPLLVAQTNHADQLRQRLLNDAMLKASRTRAEREAEEALKKAGAESMPQQAKPPAANPPSVKKKRTPRPSTANELLANLR